MPIYTDKNGDRFTADTYAYFSELTLDGLREHLKNNSESFNISEKAETALKHRTHNRNDQIWILDYGDEKHAVTRNEYKSRHH